MKFEVKKTNIKSEQALHSESDLQERQNGKNCSSASVGCLEYLDALGPPWLRKR